MKVEKQFKTILQERVVIEEEQVEEITLRVSRLEAHIIKVLTGFVGGVTNPWQRQISGRLYSRLANLLGLCPTTAGLGLSCGNRCVTFDENVTIKDQTALMDDHWKLVRAHDGERVDRKEP